MNEFEKGTIWISPIGTFSLEMEGVKLFFTGVEIREEGGEITFYRDEEPCAVVKTKYLSDEVIDKIKRYLKTDEGIE